MKRFGSFCPMLLPMVFILLSCDEDVRNVPAEPRTVTKPSFELPQEYAQKPHEIAEVDLDSNGYKEALVLYSSKTDSLTPGNDKGREKQVLYDSLQVFEYNAKTQKFTKTTNYGFDRNRGRHLEIADVDGDGTSEVLIYTDGEGTSLTASRGLTILGTARTGLKPIYNFDEGDPKIVSLENGSTRAVALSSEYGNVFSHAQNVPYVDSLVFLNEVPADKAPELQKSFFTTELRQLQEQYKTARTELKNSRSEDAGLLVFNSAMQQLLYYKKLGQRDEAKKLVKQEKSFWRSYLPEEYYDSLMDVTE